MMKGSGIMKYLKIKNNNVYFVNPEGEEKEIDDIGKEDILYLLNEATSEDVEFEMDVIEEDNIRNEAHKIIYTELYKKFVELIKNKDRFIDESTNLYKDAFNKYKEV